MIAKPKNILSVKLDFLFKLIFGDERNIDILADFLTDILELPRNELEKIEILGSALKKEHEDDKLGILDVNIRIKSGALINIEIQILNKKDFEKRTVYYTGKRLTGQIGEGDSYIKLNKTISINIIDFDLFKHTKYHSTFMFIEETEGTKLTDIVRIDFLELQKAKKLSKQNKDCDNKMLWMDFLNAESEEDLLMLEQRSEVFKKPVAEVIRLSGDALTRAEYESRQKAMWDRIAEIEFGIERGIEQGMERAMIEVVRNMFKEGESIEKIAKITKLTPEKIKTIIK